MNVWNSGCESSVLDAILAGRKTIERRLARGKFAQYAPGDTILLRRDRRDANGVLHDGEKPEVQVTIVAVRRYTSFAEMMQHEPFRQVVPYADTPEEAVAAYTRYYSAKEQQEHGVLAIEIASPKEI